MKKCWRGKPAMIQCVADMSHDYFSAMLDFGRGLDHWQHGGGMKNKFFAGVALVAVAFVTPAGAADLPSQPVYKAAPVSVTQPAPNWTGFYVGVNGGYGWHDPTVNYTPNDTNAYLSTCGNQRGEGTCVPSASFNTTGAVGGFQAGYNWQFNANWLAGVEADFDWSGIKGGATSSFILNSYGSSAFNATEKIESFGTLRGRLGFLPLDTLQIYGTGGLAYGNVKESAVVPGLQSGTGSNSNGGFSYICGTGTGQANCFNGSSSKTIPGWAVGAGGEYMITNNLILRAEYLYVNLGHLSSVNAVATSSGASMPSSFTADFGTVSFNVFRGGLSWKF